jgi:hypothetical protein
MPARGFWILHAGGGQTSAKEFRECANGNWRCKFSNFSVETYFPSKFKFKLTCVGCDSMVSSPLYFSSWDLCFCQQTANKVQKSTLNLPVEGVGVNMKSIVLGIWHDMIP